VLNVTAKCTALLGLQAQLVVRDSGKSKLEAKKQKGRICLSENFETSLDLVLPDPGDDDEESGWEVVGDHVETHLPSQD
jgi:hypothetical protein